MIEDDSRKVFSVFGDFDHSLGLQTGIPKREDIDEIVKVVRKAVEKREKKMGLLLETIFTGLDNHLFLHSKDRQIVCLRKTTNGNIDTVLAFFVRSSEKKEFQNFAKELKPELSFSTENQKFFDRWCVLMGFENLKFKEKITASIMFDKNRRDLKILSEETKEFFEKMGIECYF